MRIYPCEMVWMRAHERDGKKKKRGKDEEWGVRQELYAVLRPHASVGQRICERDVMT
jgi:hypothetical protein